MMKRLLVALACIIVVSGCSLFRGGQKYGCPSDGKNIGAERIASGDPAAMKAAKKAKKFRH